MIPGVTHNSDIRQEQEALVQRICASRYFVRSARLRDFLHYVCTRALDGRPSELSETDIAREVFGRGDDFAPFDDSIVRSSARQLRIKLKEYFDEESPAELWRIEIPKGSYVPVFSRLGTAEPAASASPARRSGLLRASVAVNVILVVMLGAAFLRLPLPPSPPPAQPSLLTAFLANTTDSVLVVASDFSLAALRYVLRHDATVQPLPVTLEEYTSWDYSALTPQPSDSPESHRVYRLLRTHRLTRSGDLTLSARLLQAAGPTGRRLAVRHARDIAPRDLRTGSCILFGNPNSTPWTAPYEELLGFQWSASRGYRDRFAARGERSDYSLSGSAFDEKGSGFGRLAVMRNLSGDGKVLLISGVNMVTMEAVGEVVIDPAQWTELRRSLKIEDKAPLPEFEALLQTEAMDNAPLHARFIRIRRITR